MVSKTSLYVIKALCVLGKLKPGEYAGAQVIGERLSIPINYLSKMLQHFVKKKYVISQKGYGGGFRLAKTPDRITLLEIIEAIEEESLLSGCFWGKEQCSDKDPCPFHSQWKPIAEQIRYLFKTTTIADIMNKMPGQIISIQR